MFTLVCSFNPKIKSSHNFTYITEKNYAHNNYLLHDIARLILILHCFIIQDNNRYNIYIQFSIQYQDCGVKNVKNLALS